MSVTPRNPPRKTCGLATNQPYRVTTAFSCVDAWFVHQEVLIFAYEMHDVNNGCDIWVFRIPNSKRTKCIYGYEDYRDPQHWLANFEEVPEGSKPHEHH